MTETETETNMDTDSNEDETNESGQETAFLDSNKEFDAENLDAIKKYIEEQEKEIQELKDSQLNLKNTDTKVSPENQNNIKKNLEKSKEPEDNRSVEISADEVQDQSEVREPQDETMAVASCMMDMILSQSEATIVKKKGVTLTKESLSPEEKGTSSVALSVGSEVEAKDFAEFWHAAQIVEVDYDEMEVLVHYKHDSKKHDEWISVSSPRLRPISSPCKTPPSAAQMTSTVECNADGDAAFIKDESKSEEKSKLMFAVGERCLARWRDNRRFMATIHADLGDGTYEIIFDDGFFWKCSASRLHKMKSELSIDTSVTSTASTLSPVYGAGPSSVTPTTSYPSLPFHTHLFDPTRDYLGSKSERREMKRKLNIKEIFNIGQKRQKKEKSSKNETLKRNVVEKKPKVVKSPRLKLLEETDEKVEAKMEIPEAVASIIGTVTKEQTAEQENKNNDETVLCAISKNEEQEDIVTTESKEEKEIEKVIDIEIKKEVDPVAEEEVVLEKFETEDKAEPAEVIDKIKEVINKLEDGLSKVEPESSSKLENRENDIKSQELKPVENEKNGDSSEKPKKKLSKVKKGKKLRLLQEKKVKKQVEKVKSELEEMKRQVEEMRQQMLMRTEELGKSPRKEMPESFLLPGEWCCKWANGQPVGTVSEIEGDIKVDSNSKPALPRRSVQVEDKRLPPGWTKHMVRRSFGNSAGKWDVVLVSPDNRRFHTKTDMRNYLETNQDDSLKEYEYALMDFGVHLKLSRRMGWVSHTGAEDSPVVPLPAGLLSSTSPLVKRKKLKLNKSGSKHKKKHRLSCSVKLMKLQPDDLGTISTYESRDSKPSMHTSTPLDDTSISHAALEDGYVYVGSLKVQIIENLLRCPAEGCFKNFRNNTLLKMHIKHYHRELRKMLGATPKVLDLAYARTTMPAEFEIKPKEDHKTIKVKIPRPPKREHHHEPKPEVNDVESEVNVTTLITPEIVAEKIPKPQDPSKLRHALGTKPVKRPKVLLPVRRLEQLEPAKQEADAENERTESVVEIPEIGPLDFETEISTHTVTKPAPEKKKKGQPFATKMSEDEWCAVNSDVDTMSSFPRSGSPDSKLDVRIDNLTQPVYSESNEDKKDTNMYMFTENGERIKIVHMKREEIINCHCGFREEDGLMVQCELCLCWQHALCHNIQKESEVPEKYTCSICLNPRRGRRSQRFLHDQDRLYEGLLPGAKPCESLRRSHELSGNLLRIEDALHALRVKYYVATKKDHPKLYLWAKDWENSELSFTQEKLNSDYSDLNIMISSIGKENLPIKPEEMRDMPLDVRTPPSEEQDGERFSQRDGQIGSQSLLSGLLSSPGGASLDLPISTSELERLAKSVQEQEAHRVPVCVPQPEAAIENSACRERLLRHIQRCQALVDARLDSIEAQVAELESQDPSFEDDETADYFPRTKQTIQMMMRDLDTMEELGVIT